MEDDLSRRTASPSLRRRAPVDVQRGSPALSARKQVLFTGFNIVTSTNNHDEYNHGLRRDEREKEEEIYTVVKNNNEISHSNLDNRHSSTHFHNTQNVTHLEILGQSSTSRGILKTSKNGHSSNRHINLDISNNPLDERSGSQKSPGRRYPSLDRARSQSVDDLGPHRSSHGLRRDDWGGSRQNIRTNHVGSTESAWAGTKLGGRVDGKSYSVKSYWEQNCKKEEELKQEEAKRSRPKSYGFPRWRSSDALSASLVASNKVEIPRDSRIPDQRLQKMEETEKEANTTRLLIQEQASPPKRLSKGKSLESLSMQVDYQPWYDRSQIKDSIIRESISNIGLARERFENASNSRAPSTTPMMNRFATPQQNNGLKSANAGRQVEGYSPYPNMGSQTQLNMAGTQRSSDVDRTNHIGSTPKESYSNGHHTGYIRDVSFSGHHNNYPPPPAPSGYNNPSSYSTPNGYSSNGLPPMALNTEKQLLLLYLRQNSEMVASLGILIPDQIREIIDHIPWRKVELRSVDEEAQSYMPQGISPSQRNAQNGNLPQGRYVKNQMSGPGNMPRFVKKTEVSGGRIPDGRRQSVQESDQKSGESFIAAEIRQLKEREEELRRSRSELGLPNLEESMDMWRHGQRGVQQIQQPLRSAISYDHLHQMPDTLHKAASIDQLTLTDDGIDYTPSRRIDGKEHPVQQRDFAGQPPRGQQNFRSVPYSQPNYKLQRAEDPDVMAQGPARRRDPPPPQSRRFE